MDLKTTLQNLSNYIECNATMSGDIHFNIAEACQLRSYIEELEKKASELEKIEDYNNSAANYCPPEYRKIKGKAPQDCSPNISSNPDNVNHPSHYTWLKDYCGIEPIDITRHMNFNLGNAIKYILRSGHKTEQGMTLQEKQVEDLKKAIFYLKDEINKLEK